MRIVASYGRLARPRLKQGRRRVRMRGGESLRVDAKPNSLPFEPAACVNQEALKKTVDKERR